MTAWKKCVESRGGMDCAAEIRGFSAAKLLSKRAGTASATIQQNLAWLAEYP